MNHAFPRLLGDVGGTSARWAWQAEPGAALTPSATYRCAEFDSVHAVIERFLRDHQLPRPAALAFGIATAITGDAVRMTNLPWAFSIDALRAALGVAHCLVLNDFEAIANALSTLADADVRPVGGGAAVAGTPRAVLGPGTGLGVAGLVPGGAGRLCIVAGEGGHVTLAAGTPREAAVLAQLQQRFGHASAERALSGPGLVNLYDAIGVLDARPTRTLQPDEVVTGALLGADPACREALQLFGALLGSEAGNLALTLGARGGVYLGGGIVPRLGTAFDALPFRERFEAKGRFRSYLERIPTFVITAPTPALQGAANALDALAG